MNAIICTERISKYVEEEYIGGSQRRVIRIQNNKEIFSRYKKRVWRRRQKISKSSRVEEIGIKRKNDGEVCTRVQESS